MSGNARPPLLRLRHFLEATTLRAAFAASRALGIDRASAAGGALLRALGPLTPLHRRAAHHLAVVLPGMGAERRRAVLRDMWENVGRYAFEWPHLLRLDPFDPASHPLPDGSPRFVVEGAEHLERVRASGRSAVIAAAHIANWEVGLLVCVRAGLPMMVAYREAKNPASERLIQRIRGKETVYVHKRRAGRHLLQAVRENRCLGILNDQKLIEGVRVPFLGLPAGTAAPAAAIALRRGLPVVPIHVKRRSGAGFEVRIEPPLAEPDPALARDERIRLLLLALNDRYSAWIRERPGEWLWMHRRWPEDVMPPEGSRAGP